MKAFATAIVLSLMMLWSARLPADLYGQTFTRITDGEIVTKSNVASGASWGDYNNDGYLDLYVTNSPATGNEIDDRRNELYLNQGDGTFALVTTGAIVRDRIYSPSSIWVDVDNDGWIDLYVSNTGSFDALLGLGPFPGANALYLNQGDGTFTRVDAGGPVAGVNVTWSSSWSDFDKDGDLDLFSGDLLGTINLFYRHDAEGSFVLDDTVPFAATGRAARAANWVDFDNDGDDDLFIVNIAPSGMNQLYRNMLAETGRSTFEEITESPLLTDVDIVNAAGASWIDYDNDGDLDVYLNTVFIGTRNHLYRNNGGGAFERILQGNELTTEASSASGSCWGDYDNDGDLDVFVPTDDSPATADPDQYFVNEGNGQFTRIKEGALVEERYFSKGCANGDYDNDGDLDLFLATGDNRVLSAGPGAVREPNVLFRNDDGNQNNWINISLRGTTSNHFGIGAKVFATATIGGVPRTQMRWVAGGPTGDKGQNSLRVHFGLGDATTIDALTVEWPSGQVDSLDAVAANQFLTITETELPVANEEEPSVPRHAALYAPYPNPFQAQTTIRFDLPHAAFVTLTVYDLQGRDVATLVADKRSAGVHEVSFEAGALPSGLYLYRLQAGSAVQVRAMMLRK